MERDKITIDSLAVMVKKGFDSVDKRLDDLEKGQMDIKLSLELEKRVRKLETKLKVN